MKQFRDFIMNQENQVQKTEIEFISVFLYVTI